MGGMGGMGVMPGGGGAAMVNGMPYMAGYMPWMMNPDALQGANPNMAGAGRRHSGSPYMTLSDLERLQERIEDRLQRMAEFYQKSMAERDAVLFGTEQDRLKE
ncbi:hypothetical protein LTR53_019082, partial [Teratosphaeriaceae sp. CCFEE 6253]